MDRVLSDLQPGLGTTAIVGELTLTKTGTTARTVTFPDAAITAAGLGLAQTWTADQTFDVIKTNHCDAATSAGVHIGNLTHQDVAIFGAGGGQGSTFYGQINGTTLSMSGQITSTLATGTAPLVVASTTAVANLNASLLLGQTWANPGAIGGTTPAAGAFTTVVVSNGASFAAGSIYGNAINGLSIAAKTGSSNDLVILTPAGFNILTVPTGTQTANFAAGISCTTLVAGNIQIAPISGYNGISLNGAGSLTSATGIYSLGSDQNLYLNVPSGLGINLRVNGVDNLNVFGVAPGTPGAGQVWIGAGQIKAGAAISCAGLTSTDTIFSSNGTVQTIMSYGSTYGTIGTNSAHDLYLIRGGSQKATLTASAFNLSSGVALQINGTQVVGAQGAAVADASGGATVDAEARTAINTLLARMRAHGAIAT